MRSKGTETGDTLEGDPPEDEGGVSSSVPSGGVSHWPPQQSTMRVCPSASDMLYVNLEESCPSSPPFLERDPNMSSTARYSPLHSAPPHSQAPPYVAGLLPMYPAMGGSVPTGNQGQGATLQPGAHYMQYHTLPTERLAPLLQGLDPQGQAQGETTYYPPLGVASDAYGVSSTLYMPPPPPPHPPQSHATQLMDASDLQLVLSSNGEYHMIDGTSMKEQVGLLITGGQPVMSYSLSNENGFIVARPTVTSTATSKEPVTDVVSDNNSMAVNVSILDSLDEGSQFDEDQSIAMESETLDNTNLHFGQADELVLQHESDDISPSQLEEVECGEIADLEDIAEYLESESPSPPGDLTSSRSRRKQYDADNTITCIPDKLVPSRARASLPAAHLCLGAGVGSAVHGVFARRRIPARARFGPLEGAKRRLPRHVMLSNTSLTEHVKYLLHTSNGDYAFDVSDERTSNWMCYVRFDPGPSQNVCLEQLGSDLYFISRRPIAPRQELILGYSSAYAQYWGLPAPPMHDTDMEDSSLEWPCYECSMRFATSPELQAHLNTHDDEKDFKSSGIRKQRKKPLKNNTTEHLCAVCKKTFPRIFSLKRHMQTHAHHNANCDINSKDVKGRYDSNTQCSPKEEFFRVNSESSNDLKMDSKNRIKTEIPDIMSMNPINSIMTQKDHILMSNPMVKRESLVEHEQEQLVPDSQMEQDSMDSGAELIGDDSYDMGQKENASSEANIHMFTCNICNKVLANAQQFEIHSKVHESGGLKAVPCPACPTENIGQIKSQHIGVNGSDAVPNSTTDDGVSSQAVTTNVQLKTEGKEIGGVDMWGIQCPICPRTFRHGGLLKEHLRNQHCRADGKYDCPLCDQILLDYRSIKKHIRGFHAIRRFSCQQCGNNFSSTDKLRLHMLKHSDRREFMCGECGQQFKRRDKLRYHTKKQHSGDESGKPLKATKAASSTPPVDPTAYLRFTFKCEPCKLGFKRRGMLVNHLARRHPEVVRTNVPELQLPILRVARNYYCQHCDKVYKSSSKRKAHILKNHPGESIPPSSRGAGWPQGSVGTGAVVGGYSACVGAVPSAPHLCPHQPCHKQYASKAKLLQHIRLKHPPQASTADSKENALQKVCGYDSPSKNDVTSSTNRPEINADRQQVLISSDIKILKTNKMNYSSHNESENHMPLEVQIKPKPMMSPPPLHPMGTSVKWDNKILTSLLSTNSSWQASEPKLISMDPPNTTKPLSEIKLGGYLTGSLKQSLPAPKNIWKNSADSATLLDSLRNGNSRLRLIQLSDGTQILEEADTYEANCHIKSLPSGRLILEDQPKVHISGNMQNGEGTKLPPMSVLAGSSNKGRYTDR